MPFTLSIKMIYPNLVYKVPGSNFGVNGKTYDWKQVNSDAELEDLKSKGWFENLHVACGIVEHNIIISKGKFDGESCFEARVTELPDVAEYADSYEEAYALAIDTIEVTAQAFSEQGKEIPAELPNTRKDLEEKCKALGIKVDGRMKDATLLKLIEGASNVVD